MGIDETQSYRSYWLSPNIFLYDTYWICDSALSISFSQYFLPGWQARKKKEKLKEIKNAALLWKIEGLPIEFLKGIVLQSFPHDDYLYTRSLIGNLCLASNQSAICQEVKPAMESPAKFDNNLIINFWWHRGSTTSGSTPVYTTYSTTSTSATSMDSPSESYKKQNGLDYPVNVARWGNIFIS